MPSQNTRRKVRLNEKVESRVRGNLSARFGGECLETYRIKTRKGAGCLAYCYTTEETEKLELMRLTEKLGGNIELAIRQLADSKRSQVKGIGIT